MTVARAVANISPVLSYYSAVQLIIYKRVLFMATVMVNYYLLDYVSIARQRPFDGRGLEAGFSSLSTYYYFFFSRFLSFMYLLRGRKNQSSAFYTYQTHDSKKRRWLTICVIIDSCN